MLVCPRCFDDSKTLQEYIESEGIVGDCPTCGTKGTKIIDVTKLRGFFESLSQYYQVAQPGKHYVYDSEDDCVILGDAGDSLGPLLQEDWAIFSEQVSLNDVSQILEEVWPDYDRTSEYTKDDLWYTAPDAEFQYLAERLMHERRFFPKEHTPEPGRTPIEQLLANRLPDYARPLGQAVWFRARRHEVVSEPETPKSFLPSDMSAPPKEQVSRGGRVNPAGISYLYLGSTVRTVIAEIRSFPGDYVSIGQFTVADNLVVIDLTAEPQPLDPFACEDLRWNIERRSLLRELGRRLSQPVREEEHELQYVATQYLAEFIASKDYAGIIYPSAMSTGVNLVLFDSAQATCTKVAQYRIDKLDLTYKIRPLSPGGIL